MYMLLIVQRRAERVGLSFVDAENDRIVKDVPGQV